MMGEDEIKHMRQPSDEGDLEQLKKVSQECMLSTLNCTGLHKLCTELQLNSVSKYLGY